MADEPTGQAPDTTQDADGQEPDADATPTPPWGSDDDFDPRRAWKLIEDLKAERDELKAKRDAAREAAEKAERQARDAEEAKLAEQEQFKELADKRSERLLELEPKVAELEATVGQVTAERDEAVAALQKHVDAMTKDIPEYVRDLLAGKSPVQVMDYISKHGDSFRKSGATGVPDSPSPNGDHKMSADEKRALAARPGRDY